MSYRPLLVHGSDAGDIVRAYSWVRGPDAPVISYLGSGADTADLGGGTNTCVDVEQGGC